MGQLEGVPDVPLARIRGHPDRGRELGDRELRHQRRTLTRDRHPGVAVPAPDRRGVVDRVGRVHRRPVHRGLQQAGLGTVRDPPDRHAQQPTPHSRCRAPRRTWSWVNSSTHHRHSKPENPLFDRDVDNYLRNLSTATTRVDLGDRDCESSCEWPLNHSGGRPRNPKIFPPPTRGNRASTGSADVRSPPCRRSPGSDPAKGGASVVREDGEAVAVAQLGDVGAGARPERARTELEQP